MTKTGIEFAKMEHEKELQGEKFEHETEENRKKNRASIIGAAIGAVGRTVPALVKQDAAWYKQYIENLDVFGHLPTFNRLGDVPTTHYLFGKYSGYHRAIPGIMVFDYESSIGSQNATSFSGLRDNPLNQVLMRTKSQVLKLNSRSNVSWEAADLGLNVLASAEILTAILELRRAIEIYYTYSVTNKYLAESLVTALGWSFSDMSNHIADYKEAYEVLRKRFNADIVAPTELTLYARKHFLATHIFVDSPSKHAQIYVYNKRGGSYLVLNAAGDTLEPTTFAKTTISAYQAAVSNAIGNLTENPDFIEMYSDLRHAVRSGKLVTLQLEPQGKEVDLIYSAEVIGQIQNIITLPITASSGWIQEGQKVFSCANGYLYQGTSVTTTSTDGKGQTWTTTDTGIINAVTNLNNSYDRFLYRFTEKSNNVDGALVNSRMMFYPEFETFTQSGGGTACRAKIVSTGTEIVVNLRVRVKYSSSGSIYDGGANIGTFTYVSGLSNLNAVSSYLSVFDWHPMVNFYDSTFDVQPHGDVDKIFVMSRDDLDKLHEVSVMSLFYLNVKEWNQGGAE